MNAGLSRILSLGLHDKKPRTVSRPGLWYGQRLSGAQPVACVSVPRTRQQLIQRVRNFLPILGQGTYALTELIERHGNHVQWVQNQHRTTHFKTRAANKVMKWMGSGLMGVTSGRIEQKVRPNHITF